MTMIAERQPRQGAGPPSRRGPSRPRLRRGLTALQLGVQGCQGASGEILVEVGDQPGRVRQRGASLSMAPPVVHQHEGEPVRPVGDGEAGDQGLEELRLARAGGAADQDVGTVVAQVDVVRSLGLEPHGGAGRAESSGPEPRDAMGSRALPGRRSRSRADGGSAPSACSGLASRSGARARESRSDHHGPTLSTVRLWPASSSVRRRRPSSRSRLHHGPALTGQSPRIAVEGDKGEADAVPPPAASPGQRLAQQPSAVRRTTLRCPRQVAPAPSCWRRSSTMV